MTTKKLAGGEMLRRDVLRASVAMALAGAAPLWAFATDAAAPIAKTTAGKIRGVMENGISVFKGVRYGADTATTRFQAPRPPTPWSETVDALDYGNQAPQPGGGDGVTLFKSWANRRATSEDCLFLNIWTPALRDNKKRPVMVWFHGGGFSTGSGASKAYDGVRLAKRGDVVVVTVNHRLNVFGHLYLGAVDNAAARTKFADSGNVGTLDLVLALEWVRDNIAEFGGDPHNVLIFGESGGGAKVSTLMAMPRAKGLFHRAVVESGAWLLFNESEAAAKTAQAVVEALGLTAATLDQITTLPVEKIQDAARKAAGANWGPVLDKKNLSRHPFTPDAPMESKNVPLLIGFNRTESTLLVGIRDPAYFDLTFETLPVKLAPLLPGADAPQIIENYRKLYPKHTASDIFFAATTDSRFLRAHVAEVERKAAQVAQGGAPAYFYMVNWNTPVEGGKWRAPHALEIGFVFDNVAKSESMSGIGPEQQRLADLMSEAWIAFARTGNPNNKLLPTWPAYDAKQRATMVFDVQPKVVNDIHGVERSWFDTMKMGASG